MAAARVISKTDLARPTRQVVAQVRRGQTVIIQSNGQEEVPLNDILDYLLLRAVTAYQTLPPHSAPFSNPDLAPRGLEDQEVQTIGAQAGGDVQAVWNPVIASYLDGNISLGRTAELLNLSSFDLRERFNRVGIPLRLGPATIEEAQAEFQVLPDENRGSETR